METTYSFDYMFYAYTYTGNYEALSQPSMEVKNSVPAIVIDTKKRDEIIASLNLDSIREKVRKMREEK